MATQSQLPANAQVLTGANAANVGWSTPQLTAIHDHITRDMQAGKHVLTVPLDDTMPRGDVAADLLARALGDIFTVIINPFEGPTGTMTFVPDVQGIHARKAARVLRPKNCFVIYRLDKHIYFKSLNPGMSNNDLSKVIAERWRNEPKSVKDEYKRRADEEKRQHAIAHPGYQYQPRKPSEKKKRMTKNKLARLAAANNTVQPTLQAPTQQQPLPVYAAPAPAPTAPEPAPPTFEPTLDELVALQATGDWPDVDLPHFNDPANQLTSRFAPFGEQVRQGELDDDNTMQQYFAFEDADGPIPADFAPADSWGSSWTTTTN